MSLAKQEPKQASDRRNSPLDRCGGQASASERQEVDGDRRMGGLLGLTKAMAHRKSGEIS
jgi:hypothetical protein